MKSSICVIGLNRTFTKQMAYAFASHNELYYVDVDEMIKFDLIDVMEAKRLCGVEYIDKVTLSRIKNISTFENTVFTIASSNLNNSENLAMVKKNALVVYLDLPKRLAIEKDKKKSEKVIENASYKLMNEHYKTISDITVKLSRADIKQGIARITDGIREYYEK